MPKIDFNVPFTDETGAVVRKPALDKTKTKLDQRGNLYNPPKLDADGNLEQEDVMVKDLLATAIASIVAGDDTTTYEDRVARGKLARKLSDATKGSLKNYSTLQLQTIKDVLLKAQASPLLMVQVEELIEGDQAEGSETNEESKAA